ncbi:MAG: hypothetical protein H6959_07460 [Chromatiaceae bacterium]|nr:hypothetical protein [Gammaproteobacteria bacterium]MCP5300670.1 hypothetical protein [Chromatiaceae bacterium]MCP5422742.1 hypothetical protein [Chromatiaceae bacterium]
MKILRIRRGFTTNSSAYTEWLPPTSQQGNAGAQAPPGQSTTPPAAQGAVAPGTTPTVPAATAGASSPTAGATPPGHAAGNTLTVVGVIGALLAVFVTERVIRRLRRNRRPDDDADE